MAMFMMIQVSIASTTGVINYDTVRVRRDPEQDLKKTKTYALVSIGDKVEVLGKEGNWYKITCTYEGKQVTGYVRSDLIDVKNPENVPVINTSDDDDNNSNNSSNNNNNSNSSNNNNNSNSNNNSNNNQNTQTSNPNTSNQNPTENPNNSTTTPTTEQPTYQSETTLTTIKLGQNVEEGNKIKLTNDTNIKILPVVNSTNIGQITSGTEVTVVEVVNKWVRIETEELIGWARVE